MNRERRIGEEIKSSEIEIETKSDWKAEMMEAFAESRDFDWNRAEETKKRAKQNETQQVDDVKVGETRGDAECVIRLHDLAE